MKTTLDQILFPVSKIQNPAKTNTEYSHIVLGEINGESMHLNYCSNRYELIPNDTIFPRIESDLNARGYKFTSSYQMVDHVRFYASYILEDDKFIVSVGNDKFKPTIKIDHSYNGLTKYRISFGYFRLICSNGLTIPVEGQEDKNLSISGKHTKDIINSLTLLWGKLDYFFSLQETFKKRIEVLTDRKIDNYAERVEAVMSATNLKPSKAQFQSIIDTIKFESETLYNGQVNDWLVYNGINGYIFNGVDSKGDTTKATPDKKFEIDAKVLAEIMS